MKPDNFVIVYRASGEFEAELVRGKLKNAGIPTLYEHESGGTAIGLTINGWGEFRILVPAAFENQAREVLAEVSSSPSDG